MSKRPEVNHQELFKPHTGQVFNCSAVDQHTVLSFHIQVLRVWDRSAVRQHTMPHVFRIPYGEYRQMIDVVDTRRTL
jgi:hypothetical protein